MCTVNLRQNAILQYLYYILDYSINQYVEGPTSIMQVSHESHMSADNLRSNNSVKSFVTLLFKAVKIEI